MSIATVAIPASFNSADVLTQLGVQAVRFCKQEEVEHYLAEHSSLGILLPAICSKVRAGFESPSELWMKVYHDPEIKDCYLSIYVRQASYDSDILERLDCIMAEFESQLEAASGFLLLTTDFKRPGASDVI